MIETRSHCKEGGGVTKRGVFAIPIILIILSSIQAAHSLSVERLSPFALTGGNALIPSFIAFPLIVIFAFTAKERFWRLGVLLTGEKGT